jgi:hypothetical protein
MTNTLCDIAIFFDTYVNNKYEWKIMFYIFCNFLRLIVSASDDSWDAPKLLDRFKCESEMKTSEK